MSSTVETNAPLGRSVTSPPLWCDARPSRDIQARECESALVVRVDVMPSGAKNPFLEESIPRFVADDVDHFASV
jgi:hypothetical protein